MSTPRVSRRFHRRRSAGERGVLLVALMVGMTVMMILLTASAQSWTAVMKREREEELIFRGNQYITALKAYAADHGGNFPPQLKLLMEKGPKGNRYLRQLFGDPFDPKGEWNLIYLGPDGKSAWNPHARPPSGLLPGQDPMAGLGLAGRTSGGRGRRLGGGARAGGFGEQGGIQGGPGGASPAGLGGRESGFASGNLNTPIVGVVSRSSDMGFREYFSKQYYNEWEFHVFLKDIPGIKPGPVPGLNINPSGQVGPGGGPTLVDPNDRSTDRERPGSMTGGGPGSNRGGKAGTPRPPGRPKPGGN